jgi:hypothetical protein
LLSNSDGTYIKLSLGSPQWGYTAFILDSGGQADVVLAPFGTIEGFEFQDGNFSQTDTYSWLTDTHAVFFGSEATGTYALARGTGEEDLDVAVWHHNGSDWVVVDRINFLSPPVGYQDVKAWNGNIATLPVYTVDGEMVTMLSLSESTRIGNGIAALWVMEYMAMPNGISDQAYEQGSTNFQSRVAIFRAEIVGSQAVEMEMLKLDLYTPLVSPFSIEIFQVSPEIKGFAFIPWGDGAKPRLFVESANGVYVEINPALIPDPEAALGTTASTTADLNGDGISDILFWNLTGVHETENGTAEPVIHYGTSALEEIILEIVNSKIANVTFNGSEVSEVITMQDGDDVIIASKGNDTIDGGDGTDSVSYDGSQNSYTVTLGPSGVQVRDRRPDGNDTDTLTNIEFLEFDTGDFANFNLEQFGGATSLNEVDFKGFIELYIAYFNRAPDAIGLNFWGTAYANGTTMEEMATLFVDQDETRATYPEGTSNSVFAESVYNNVLGRTPDQAGIDFWVKQLNDKLVTRDQFILKVLEGAKSDLKPELGDAFVQQQLADRTYLENKIDIGAYLAVHKGMSDVDDAIAAMAIFDGSQASINGAVAAIDGFYADALDPNNGEFLMQVVGVLDNPFEVM